MTERLTPRRPRHERKTDLIDIQRETSCTTPELARELATGTLRDAFMAQHPILVGDGTGRSCVVIGTTNLQRAAAAALLFLTGCSEGVVEELIACMPGDPGFWAVWDGFEVETFRPE